MRFTSLQTVLGLLVVASAGAARAQDSTAATASAAQAQNCNGPEYRQFDFWVGEWDVTYQGKKAGVNRITKEENGCLIHERWTGRGSTGQSMNFYDRSTGKWHQIWVDNTGGVLHLSGTYADGQLHYTGPARDEGGKRVIDDLTFFNNADGTVRQLWRVSADGGKTWNTVFDGLYRRKAGSAAQ